MKAVTVHKGNTFHIFPVNVLWIHLLILYWRPKVSLHLFTCKYLDKYGQLTRKRDSFRKAVFFLRKLENFFSFSVKYKERYDRWNKFTLEVKVTRCVRWLFVTLKRIFLSFFTYKNTIIFSNVNKEKIFQLIVKLILLWFFCEKCRARRGSILFGFFGVGFT